MTERRKEALQIIKEHGPIRPRPFSKKFWPDSDGHKRYSPCGQNGATSGGGMWLAAGGYLAKLRKAGLVREKHVKYSRSRIENEGYILTNTGREKLKEELDQ